MHQSLTTNILTPVKTNTTTEALRLPIMNKSIVAIIGLGYVGLPLAVTISEKYPTIGYDIDHYRIDELQKGIDRTREVESVKLLKNQKVSALQLKEVPSGLYLTNALAPLSIANIYIITVPTPTDKFNRPDLGPVLKATAAVAKNLKKGDLVIYESTVYPGVTEDECAPLLEEISGLEYNMDFFLGYSPERINPGDKQHQLTTIKKVTSGSTPQAASFVDDFYRSFIGAGTHLASSIRVAEAAKVIENSQRDINIAFVNELSKIFNLLGIDTSEVLEAASTKWNFLPFKPGLVGGHCIGIDPYYLAQKAQEVGYHPEIILAGRRINDSMGKHVATEVIKLMMRKNIKVLGAKALILGFTFKEDCPDVRNTRVIDIYKELNAFDLEINVYDPCADHDIVETEYGITLMDDDNNPDFSNYQAIIIAVSHSSFKSLNVQTSKDQVIYDVKGIFDKHLTDARL